MSIFNPSRLFNPLAWFNRKRRRSIKIQAFVTVRDKEGRIVGKGKSKPNNLILDQFGKWLAGMILAVAVGDHTISVFDITNTGVTLRLRSGSSSNDGKLIMSYSTGIATGTKMQVGSGTTPATRADYNIETAFGTAPESGLFNTGSGSYGAGTITFSGSVSAGGSGTVNEVGFFATWLNSVATAKTIMLFHDILTSGVPFTPGQSITAEYSISL